MVNRFEALLLPGCCILCGAASGRAQDLCPACERALPSLGHHCQQCALPLVDINQQHCGQCLQKPPDFQTVIAAWRYQSTITRLIAQFKYQRKHHYGQVLGELLGRQLLERYRQQPLPDVIVATPMHWLRRCWRGFNHSEQLACQLAAQLKVPVFAGVRRVRYSKAQQSLSAAERQRNLRGVFQVKQPLTGLSVAVVDDVVTTGATASELSRCLHKAGAEQVHIWCLARTPK